MDTLDQFAEVDVGLGTSSVDWHPDGRTLLVAVENELLLVDPATAKVRRRLDVGGRNGAVVYHPSGRLLATSDSTRGRVVFRDAATLEPSGAEVVLPAEVVTDAANIDFSPDGSLLATGQNDGYVRLWNVGTREEAGSPLLHGGMVNGVSFSADGSYIVSTNWSGETAKVWDVAKREQVGETLRHKGVVWSGTFHPGGELLVVESNDRNSTLWHWRTGTDLTAYLEHPAGVGDSAFTPSGRTLYTVTVGSRDQASGGVRRWDFPRIPASLREATLRTSLFTGVERIASDKHVTLTPERWSEYRAELAAIEATDQ
jgi:WD40 repeat protein